MTHETLPLGRLQTLTAQVPIWKWAWFVPAAVMAVGCIPLLASGGMHESLPTGLAGLTGILAILFLLCATTTDLYDRKIPNWLTYPTVAYALLLNCVSSLAAISGLASDSLVSLIAGIGFPASLAGGLICFSGMFVLFLLFGGGAGDVKMMAAIGCLTGWRTGFEIWCAAMVIAGVGILCWLCLRYGLLGASHILEAVLKGKTGKNYPLAELLKRRLPLAPFFTAGYVAVFAHRCAGAETSLFVYLDYFL